MDGEPAAAAEVQNRPDARSSGADPLGRNGGTAGESASHAASAAHAFAAMRHDPAAIRHLFESGEYPYKSPMRTAPYEAHMLELQRELLKAQRWVEQTGQRLVILFEGRDAAGKGGTIKRILERVSPRVFRLVALPAPTERQKTQIYAQRYVEQLPAGG
ncbi:MAG TPA: polyphosphate kinase 2, partial [Acidisphaera sp.]|nr:polyphosphate kinase 2 [Acidisphaera sp.]